MLGAMGKWLWARRLPVLLWTGAILLCLLGAALWTGKGASEHSAAPVLPVDVAKPVLPARDKQVAPDGLTRRDCEILIATKPHLVWQARDNSGAIVDPVGACPEMLGAD